jgi:CheY-like chemotaxis protein
VADLKILMVDDDPEELILIEEALLDVGQKVHYEENGVEALNYLDRCDVLQLPCLIVLDLNMPKLNGIETLVQLKSADKYRDIKVVIYSTSVNNIEKEKCIRLGAYAYLAKPLSYAETLKTAKFLSELCP